MTLSSSYEDLQASTANQGEFPKLARDELSQPLCGFFLAS